jgi:putative oxidoreductase
VSNTGDDGLFNPNIPTGRGGRTYNSAGTDPAQPFSSVHERQQPPPGTDQATTAFPYGGRPEGRVNEGAEFVEAPEYQQGYAGLGEPFNRLGDGAVPEARQPARWHAGADIGLLILRFVVGGSFVAHGVRHMFGLLGGTGFGKFVDFVGADGFKYHTIMAWLGGSVELGAGALVILGLATPLAAGALLALISEIVVLKWHSGFFGAGYEYPLLLAAGAFALLFAGPGRVSLDVATPWYRRPILNGFLFGLLAAGAVVVVHLVLHVRA